MAKKIFKPRQHDSGSVITTKTGYGSDSTMIVDISQYTEVSLNTDEVICKDDRGFYITKKNRINSGLADPNRYSNEKARITLEELEVSSS